MQILYYAFYSPISCTPLFSLAPTPRPLPRVYEVRSYVWSSFIVTHVCECQINIDPEQQNNCSLIIY